MSPLASMELSSSSVSVGELLVKLFGRRTVHCTALADSRFSHSAKWRATSSLDFTFDSGLGDLLPKLTRTCPIVCFAPNCCCSTTVHLPPLGKTSGFSG